jgi:DNA-binding MarR family transcriptional regulator
MTRVNQAGPPPNKEPSAKRAATAARRGAAREQVTQSAITQIVTRLEQDGLVERQRDPSDGRAVLVHITAPGAAIIDGRRAERMARLGELAGRLTPADREAIAAALPALARLVALSQP